MGKQFLKKDQVTLANGGYLVKTDENQTPVFNGEFVKVQEHAHYVVQFANLAKTKDFRGKKADTLEDLKRELSVLLDNNKAIEFVKAPTAVSRELTDKLKEEALSFLDYHSASEKVAKINVFLQQFKLLNEFETFGLFFQDDVVKLNKIYTLQEVIDAVTATIDLV